jgi:hypothetical protein
MKMYISDILCLRIDPFVFKTAEFCKRNVRKVTTGISHIGYEIKKVVQGFSNLKRDVKFAVGASYKN